MAKKQKTKTKKTNVGKTIGAVLLAVLVVGGVGVTGWMTKGFTQAPTLDAIIKREARENLRTFDFKTDKSGELTASNIISFLNETNKQGEEVFSEVMENDEGELDIVKVFKDAELGIRLGSSTTLGHFSVDFEDGFTFNRAKVKAMNYSKKKTDGSNEYNKQTTDSSFTINDAEKIVLELDEDKTKTYSVITEELTFETEQEFLSIVSLEGRPCILSLELWTE